MTAPAPLMCAICLHEQWLCIEAEKTQLREPVPAVTMVKGTAVCGLHIEDLDRAQQTWMLRIAANILGVRLRQEYWGMTPATAARRMVRENERRIAEQTEAGQD